MSEVWHLASDTPVGRVITELRDRIDPSMPPMLIGAEARDILHERLGHSFKNNATQDVDLAFVIPDWHVYTTLVLGLTPIPDTGIAFRIAKMHVDVMAFGSVESPKGTVTPPFRPADSLDVFGMTEVYAAAHTAIVGGQLNIRVPSVAGWLRPGEWCDFWLVSVASST